MIALEPVNSTRRTNFQKLQEGVSSPISLESYPHIWAICQKYPNIACKKKDVIFCFWCTNGQFSVSFRPKKENRCNVKTGSSIGACLTAIESDLSQEWPDWRHDDLDEQRAYMAKKRLLARQG